MPGPSAPSRSKRAPLGGPVGGPPSSQPGSTPGAGDQVGVATTAPAGLTAQPSHYKDIELKVSESRFVLRRVMPFFGHLLMNVPLEVSERIPTAAVTNEGRLGKLLVNPDFAKTLSRGELSAVMIHEVLHLAFNAFARMKSRDPKIWNKAHDYAINLMIDETRESNPKLGLAWSKEYPPLLDSKYAGMTAEEIYDALLQDSGGGGGNGSTSDGAQTDGEGGGPGGMEPMPGSGQGFSDATDCIMVEQPSPEDAARQERAFKNLLAEAVQVHAASRSAGKLPGSISEMVDGMLRVHVPWATQLAY